jgi:hypothetical protein
MRCVRATIIVVEKRWVFHNPSVCVFVALGTQHAMRMHNIVICGLPCCTVFFPHYIINVTIFGGKKLLNTKYVFWFPLQLLSQTFVILRRNERDMIKKMYIGLYVKCPLFVSDFNETLNFNHRVSKNPHIKFHENPRELLHADGRAGGDRHNEANSRFSQFIERP